METTTQPQTTDNSPGRDASVPIPDKFALIADGARAEERAQQERGAGCVGNLVYDYCIERSVVFVLATIIADLTSSKKYDRERAKKRVRELVKLGGAKG